MSRGWGWVVCAALLAAVPHHTHAQTLEGRVLDANEGSVVPQTLVRLMDLSGEQRALTLSDLSGSFSLTAPAPGRYRIEAERIGYAPYRSAEVEMARAGAMYRVDILVAPAPVPIRGLEVTAQRRDAAERQLRLLLGGSLQGLRNRPIDRAAIQEHLEVGHTFTDVIRWTNIPSVWVREERNGPCFLFRQRSCLPVYLDGVPVRKEIVPLLPLDLAETIVIIQPNESVRYVGGAILLYTTGWLGVTR